MSQYGMAERPVSGQTAWIGKARFETLDSWRGICALLVALMHFPASGPVSESPLIRHAFLFVDYFFVLSGFVIAHGYANRIASGLDYTKFMIVRFGRIYPLHVAVLGLFVAFETIRWLVPALRGDGAPPFGAGTSPGELITSLTLLNGLGFDSRLAWNGPSWSISAEMWTYLLFGLVLLALGRRAWIVLLAAALAGPAILYLWSPHYMDATWDYGFVRCLYGFAVGALLHRFAATGIVARRERLPASLAWTAAEVAAVAAVGAFVWVFARGPVGIAAPLVFAAAVWVFAHEGGRLSVWLRMPGFLWLGALSYGIYMLHTFIQSRMINVMTLAEKVTGADLVGPFAIRGEAFYGFGVSGDVFALMMTVVMLASVVLAALLAHLLVEKPFQTMSRKAARGLDVGMLGIKSGRLAPVRQG